MKRNSINIALFGMVVLNFHTSIVYCSDKTDSVAAITQKNGTGQIPAIIINQLKNNISDMSTCSFVWSQKRSSALDIDRFIKTINGGAGLKSFFEPERNVFMWQDGNCFLYSITPHVVSKGAVDLNDVGQVKNPEKIEDIQVNIRGMTTAMDMDNYYIGETERDTDKAMSITVFPKTEIINTRKNYPVFAQSYLSFIGLYFPTYGADLLDPPASYILSLLDEGTLKNYSEEVFDGQTLSRIDVLSNALIQDVSYERKPHLYSFWLDQKTNYAVKRLEVRLPTNELILTAENSGFTKISKKDVFLPEKTNVIFYAFFDTRLNTPLYSKEFSLVKSEVKRINPTQFDIRGKFYQSGAAVADSTLNDSGEWVTFHVPANPADLDRVIEAALTGGTFVPTPMASIGAQIFRWLLVVAGIAMIAYALYSKFVKKNS